ncbi:MAG: sugar phosphate isomerase/epimerase [Rhodospirillaceae bacterium]|jgi:sugar phosphate isomerase/epimerase|nr:sugar phosphate isomerase/epimerase [Rhodospirillaceae bacterium]MBT5944928.1 sugar phosphate isomerase/epimerase [Rhodospirillaceae bacterium]MBT6535976.1 sugar phosphate isomerase/epimerase [Rhodospirillaceae bacterium]MBT7361908.1 sugar phosphate isomerase/epimerase [Rhodospirillaceae bacterium]
MEYSLSVNHYICDEKTPFPRFAEMVQKAGIGSVGVTRAALFEMGVPALGQCLKDNGLGVSSLCSAGYFTGTQPETKAKFDDGEMIDIAAELGAATLTVISDGAGDPAQPFADAYALVETGLAKMAAQAEAKGVILGVEPIHPNHILARGCINTIAHALKIVEPHASARLLLDFNHSWWDPDFPDLLTRAPETVALIQMCNLKFKDGYAVGRETLSGGDLDMGQMIRELTAGGFQGPFEFELFPGDLRGRDIQTLISDYAKEFAESVAAV